MQPMDWVPSNPTLQTQLNSLCRRCQKNAWKGHKQFCTEQAAAKRCVKAIAVTMVEAEARWDSRTVIEAGRAVEADLSALTIGTSAYDAELRRHHSERMGRAFSRQRDYKTAVRYYDKFIAICEHSPDSCKLLARGLCLKADIQVHLMDLDGAWLSYERVGKLGERDGLFEMYAKATLGLSNIACLRGDKQKGLELAREGRAAVLLLEDSDYAKARTKASAILAIISCSDVDAEDFDETLLERLTVLAVDIDADPREGGSTICVRAAELRGARHLARWRVEEAVAAYKEIVEMAKEERFSQMSNVQQASCRAWFQILLHGQ